MKKTNRAKLQVAYTGSLFAMCVFIVMSLCSFAADDYHLRMVFISIGQMASIVGFMVLSLVVGHVLNKEKSDEKKEPEAR